MVKNEVDFDLAGLPMSCSVFLEPALEKYKEYLFYTPEDIKRFMHEWNRAMLSVLKTPNMQHYLGATGRKILDRALKNPEFPRRCIEIGNDVKNQSIHYALRFSKTINFLINKINKSSNIKFVDYGCGFSPVSAALQTYYNLNDSYCIDKPQIMEIHDKIAREVGGKIPHGISWTDCEKMALDGRVNTIVGIGIFPYLNINTQISQLYFINDNMPNFLIELKYNESPQNAVNSNAFDKEELRRLMDSVPNGDEMHARVFKDSVKNIRRFMNATEQSSLFLQNVRSMFISR